MGFGKALTGFLLPGKRDWPKFWYRCRVGKEKDIRNSDERSFGCGNAGSGARFSKVPVTFRARNQIFKSKYKRIRARVLAGNLLHFVSLTDSFIMLDAKLLKPRFLM